MNNEKKFKLPLFSREPKEIDKNEDKTPNIKYYFKSLWRKLSKIISINLIMLLLIIPIIIAIFAYLILMPRIFVFTDTLFPAIHGIDIISSSPVIDTFINITGISLEVTTFTGGWGLAVISICALFLLLTYGWQNLAATYLAKELFLGRSVFVFSDYFYAIKKNFKQGFWIGIIDFLISALLIFDFIYFYSMPSQLHTDIMFWGICGVSVIYILMRDYIYILLVTFDLSIKKIFKNALIFTALGIKRNIVSSIWIIIVGALNLVLALAFMPANIIIPLILPLFYFFGFALFTTVYAAYPVIDKYMIKPYYDEYGNKKIDDTQTVSTSAE